MQTTWISIGCLLALLFVVSACGNNEEVGSPADAVSAPDRKDTAESAELVPVALKPCSLISQERIEGIVGTPVALPTPSSEPMGNVVFHSCSSDDVHINVQVFDAASSAASMFDFGTEYPPIEGIGDKARNTQPLGEIDVLVGRYVVEVSLFTSLSKENELQAATEIARIVIEALP